VLPANIATGTGNCFNTAATGDACKAAYPANLRPHFKAVNKYRQACYVTYMYGAIQAMAMAVETTKLGRPFDPRSVDLPSMGALVGFYHACAGFPVKQTWLKAIKAGNFNSLPGLTYANASRYCPDADETIKGHLAQQRQNVRSTKPKPPATEPPTVTPAIPQGEKPLLFVKTFPISKLYTDDTGRFPIRARSGNQYS